LPGSSGSADRAVHIDAPDPTIPRQLAVGQLAYRLRPGHRLRLELASSAFPAYLDLFRLP